MPVATPVVFMIFNRPEPAAQVFSEIARAQPKTLFVIADGPRPDRPGETELCAQTRAVIDQVDWDCVVHRNYADANLGLKRRISSGLKWVFETIEEAIILEDDCLPHPTFFPFCEELLEKYQGDPRIMHISGDNFQFGQYPIASSYYFSRYPHVWGWATWRRAWAHYDVELRSWTEAADQDRYLSGFNDPSERAFWRKCWNDVAQGLVQSWAYQWAFTCLAHQGLCIIPAHNLVSNVGFGEVATNTFDQKSPLSRMETRAMRFPLSHPVQSERDVEADARTGQLFFGAGAPIPLSRNLCRPPQLNSRIVRDPTRSPLSMHERAADPESQMSRCWCGNTDLSQFSPTYFECLACKTLVAANMPEPASLRVTDDDRDFYGREYWFSHQERDLGNPNIIARSRVDLPERCLHWLRTLLRFKSPPAKVLEVGSGHGGFVALLRYAGFDAQGLELSPWIVDFARRTFTVPMLTGPVEDQTIEHASLDAIAMFDVLEHLANPVGTIRRCLDLLEPDGILLIQTPSFPHGKSFEQMQSEGNRFSELLRDKGHLYLFSRASLREFFHRLGADHLAFEPAIFAHYDMFAVVSRAPLVTVLSSESERALLTTPSGRMVQALLDLDMQKADLVQEKADLVQQKRQARERINQLRDDNQRLRNDLLAATNSLGWRTHHWVRSGLMTLLEGLKHNRSEVVASTGHDVETEAVGSRNRRHLRPTDIRLARIAVDLTPLLPGGENGGAKVLATNLVRHLSHLLPKGELVLLTSDRNHDELARFDSPNVRRLRVARLSAHPGARSRIATRLRTRLRQTLAATLPSPALAKLREIFSSLPPQRRRTGLLQQVGVDLLFCPFTAPYFSDPSVPIVSVVHDLQHLYCPQFFSPEERHERDKHARDASRLAIGLVCVSAYVRRTVLERLGVEPDRAITIHTRLFKRLKGISPAGVTHVLDRMGVQKESFLLYPSNFWPHKNHRMLLTAFGIYRARHRESRLKIVCTGAPSRQMQELGEAAEGMSLADRVLFPGYVSDEELAALFQACRALIFPSLYEGFGMPILEAMEFGKPVLCSNVTSLPEIAGDAAIYFDPRKPLDIVAAIERLETEAGLEAGLIQRGRRRLAAFGGPEVMIQEYLEAFRQAIRCHNRTK